MVRVLQQESVSSVEALRILKPYLKSNLTAVILKILTVSFSPRTEVKECVDCGYVGFELR